MTTESLVPPRLQPVHLALFSIATFVLIWSAIHPHDYFTWILEVFPALIAAAILVPTYNRFRLTTLLYTLIGIHAIILMVGGHYTYAEVPLGNWVRDAFHQSRNNYDRLGHFAQGFVPALGARELFLRKKIVRGKGWLFTIIVLCCLGISAIYELIEWRTAVASGSAADAFLGTQGDPWDTQEDMATAFVGAVVALLAFGSYHDRQLRKLTGDE
jgi:putative membrane protein